MTRRVNCPVSGYEAAHVVLPPEWLGAHLLRRDEVLAALEKSPAGKSPTLTRAAIALALADDWDGIPGLTDKHDPATWDVTAMPLGVLLWLVEAVYADFAQAFVVPKVSAAPLPHGLTATAAMSTAGS